MRHLEKKHNIFKDTPPATSSEQGDGNESSDDRNWLDLEEEQPPQAIASTNANAHPTKKRKQLPLDSFLIRRHTLRSDVQRLICESNISFNQIIRSPTIRRLLIRAYPGDPPPPKSAATLRKHLRQDAKKIRLRLRKKFHDLRSEG